MSQVAIKKVNDSDKRPLPVFDLIAKEFEVIRRRAFDRFEKRGRELGHDLEDWLRAEHELLGWPTDVYRRFEVLKPIDVGGGGTACVSAAFHPFNGPTLRLETQFAGWPS